MRKVIDRFTPRHISFDQAAMGYNNEGRGKFIGCIADVTKHDKICAYRKNPKRTPIPGEPNSYTGVICDCRIGLWQETLPAVVVMNEMRRTSKRKKPAVHSRSSKYKNSKI